MILRRLYELALREGLLEDLAFQPLPVPYYVVIGPGGTYIGIEERRGTRELPGKKGAPKRVQDAGREESVPRAHGNSANKGFARFFVDSLPRVLPVEVEEKDRDKFALSRKTFWEQIDQAVSATGDPALRDVSAFGSAMKHDEALTARVLAEMAEKKPKPGDRCSFLWQPDGGAPLLRRQAIREWFAGYFQAAADRRAEGGEVGTCQVTGVVGPIPTTHPVKLRGVPGCLPTGGSLISCDKQAFSSYGLDGARTAAVGQDAADAYGRALQALIDERLRGSPRSRLSVAGGLFLFWTRRPADTGILSFDMPVPGHVEELLTAARRAKPEAVEAVDENTFYLLSLTGNSARVIVRNYLELPLGEVRRNLGRWFADLRLADARQEGAGRPTSLFPLSHLAVATALDFDSIGPEVAPALVQAALEGVPLPEALLVKCLGRLRAEGSQGFPPARLALIKLILIRSKFPVTEQLSEDERPAYVYGRLLYLFEEIQYAALGEVNSTVVDKFYGTLSAAPALVLCRLFANAQNHLRKLRTDESKRKAYAALDRRLAEVADLLKPVEPPARLSLQEQGLFALGYYHEKARSYERRAAVKKAKAEKAARESQ